MRPANERHRYIVTSLYIRTNLSPVDTWRMFKKCLLACKPGSSWILSSKQTTHLSMYGQDILCGIPNGTFEIPHKICHSYIEKHNLRPLTFSSPYAFFKCPSDHTYFTKNNSVKKSTTSINLEPAYLPLHWAEVYIACSFSPKSLIIYLLVNLLEQGHWQITLAHDLWYKSMA